MGSGRLCSAVDALAASLAMTIDHGIHLLLDAVSLDASRFTPARARALSPDDWGALADAAGYQRVAGLLACRLTKRGLDPGVPPSVLGDLRAAARRIAIRKAARPKKLATESLRHGEEISKSRRTRV